MATKTNTWGEQIVLNILRVAAGFLFWQHGAQKLLGILGRDQPVEFFSLYGLAGVLEFVGGALLVLGLFTRPVAFILAGEMAWAYFMVHAPEGFWPILNRGEPAALYAFLFLYLFFRGGGMLSVDGLLKHRKARVGASSTGEGSSRKKPREVEPVRELTEEDLAEDPEIAELLGEKPFRK